MPHIQFLAQGNNTDLNFIYLFIYLFVVLPFLGLLSWHMDVPRLGVESEL